MSKKILIVGAGPAGLSSAVALQKRGLVPILVELGSTHLDRSQSVAKDLVTGIGGAGLFSDGKFSFYPSATNLWRLGDKEALRHAYSWMIQLLTAHSNSLPAEVSNSPDENASPSSSVIDQCTLKPYPSYYLALSERTRIVEELFQTIQGHVLTNTDVQSIDLQGSARIRVLLQNKISDSYNELFVDGIIFAAGRFGGYEWQRLLMKSTVFRRYEFGCRIEQNASDFIFRDEIQLDPKYIINDEYMLSEWRTFCCCREGLVAETDFRGIVSMSGRADCAPTGLSNVGFNCRSKEGLDRDLEKIVATGSKFRSIDLLDLLSGRTAAVSQVELGLTARGQQLLRAGLLRLLNVFGSSRLAGAMLHGPTIEGTGAYPETDPYLKVPHAPIWVAGDATGLFRGIVAGLVSGYYAGLQAFR